MRVEAYNKIDQVYRTNQSAKTREAARGKERDELTISSAGRDYQTARQALFSVPDIREDRVQAIREKMDAGTWQVSADSFAAKVIARYEEMSW